MLSFVCYFWSDHYPFALSDHTDAPARGGSNSDNLAHGIAGMAAAITTNVLTLREGRAVKS